MSIPNIEHHGAFVGVAPADLFHEAQRLCVEAQRSIEIARPNRHMMKPAAAENRVCLGHKSCPGYYHRTIGSITDKLVYIFKIRAARSPAGLSWYSYDQFAPVLRH